MDSKSRSVFTINDNGSGAVLKTAAGEFLVYSFPGNNLVKTFEADGEVMDVKFSGSGTCFAVHKIDNQLEVFCQKAVAIYAMPVGREAIYDWTIADDGKTLILLRLLFQNEQETGTINNGAVQIWSLPAADKPMAQFKVPLFRYGRISASGSGSKIAAGSTSSIGNTGCLRLLTYDSNKKTIDLQKDFDGTPLNFSFPVIFDNRVWMTSAEGLMGWRDNEPVFLPGEFREKLFFSQSGKFLLTFRFEKIGYPATRRYVFRVIDLANLKEIKNGTVLPEPTPGSCFFLSEEQELFEVAVTDRNQIKTTALKWE
jgi:hypothetical protein